MLPMYSNSEVYRSESKSTYLKIDAVISDSWKSLEVTIDFLKKNKIPVISLAHGNEIIIKNDKHHKRVKKILEYVNAIVVNSSYTKNLLNKLFFASSLISNNKTLQFLSAAKAAMPVPIVPEPNTATEFIFLFIQQS